MNLGTAQVIRADARNLPLADNSVDLVVTSPPYFALRSYQDGGEHYDGQIGSEPTPAEFVAALLEVTRECVRVLKPSGSLWVNLGDKYAGGGGQWDKDERDDPGGRRSSKTTGGIRSANTGGKTYGLRPKSLIGIPWRYALACIDDLGLILRAEVIWSKPNGLPESVTDRVRRSHEQWFHFTLEPRYFSAVDEIREAYTESSLDRARYATIAGPEGGTNGKSNGTLRSAREPGTSNPLGKLPGSVWPIPTEPLRVPDHLGIDHFAAFPTEWPRRIIQGWSSAGVCVECGEGRRPITDVTHVATQVTNGPESWRGHDAAVRHDWPGFKGRQASSVAIRGYACVCSPRCKHAYGPGDHHFESGSCPPLPVPPTTPAVVLDPFGGTGTTALVAKALGRHGITVDMSADYCRLAEWRTNDRNQLAKVLGIEKAPAADPEQLDIFGEIA